MPRTLPRMFDTLGDRLQASLGDLRKRGRLDEETISKAMREIRLALLEADVNFRVVKEFVDRVKERALGQDVAKSLTPGQQVVKIVHEELTSLMGSGSSKLAMAGKGPTVILLAGLQGSGKTTAAAKLALLLRKDGSSPALVAADLQRPAAVTQLEQLGKQIQVPVFTASDPVKAASEGIEQAKAQGRDVVIVDTAGRLQIDEPLMEELAAVRKAAKPHNVLLVLDSMTGQEAVAVAEAFQERVAFDGVVLTKLDGDAREARPARVLPSRPDGVANPRHGRRPQPDRAGRGGDRGGRAGGDGGANPRRPVHLRRLPRRAEDAQADGPAAGRAEDDPGPGQPAQGRQRRRAAARAGRGDRPLHDAAGAPYAAPDQRAPPAADRTRKRDDGSAGEPADVRPQADGEDDEADGQRQDAEAPAPDRTSPEVTWQYG